MRTKVLELFALVCALFIAGCKQPSEDSLIVVSVFGDVPGAHQLRVATTLQNGARMAENLTFPTTSGAVLVFPRSFSLRMPTGLSGSVSLRVEALSQTGEALAETTGGPFTFAPGENSAVSVCFGACPADAAVNLDAEVMDRANTDSVQFADSARDGAIDAAVADSSTIDSCVGPGCPLCPQSGYCGFLESGGAGKPSLRASHTAVWTGEEMIVWGGENGVDVLNDGAKWNRSTHAWSPMNQINTPVGRYSHTAIWANSEMVIWGGANAVGIFLRSGYRWNPTTGIWTPLSQTGAPTARVSHSAVWTGSTMIIWGGVNASGTVLSDGYLWDPVLDRWTAMPQTTTPIPMQEHSAVWADSEMVIWGGMSTPNFVTAVGARWNPTTGAWRGLSPPSGTTIDERRNHTAVWTGSEMVVFGGEGSPNSTSHLIAPFRWNAQNNSWAAVALPGTQSRNASAVWTGSEMIIWGGGGGSIFFPPLVWRP